MTRLLVLSAFAALGLACAPPGDCAVDTDCDDNDACTRNTCTTREGGARACAYEPRPASDFDDQDACTRDSCHPIAGELHEALPVSDGNACTQDLCAPATGEVSHLPLSTIDDANACTVDRCDIRDGSITHTAIPTDDGDACTVDLCDPATGDVTHPPRPEIDDDDACTVDSCSPVTGAIDHRGVPGINDDDPCTVDECLPESGVVRHLPLPALDDRDACTVDACDPTTGAVTHTSRPVADPLACTLDSCDPATGAIVHVPMDSLCPDADGATCTLPRCSATDGCIEVAEDAVCDDGFECTLGDRCDPAIGAAGTGCVNVPDSTRCGDDGLACTVEACVAGHGCQVAVDDAICGAEWCSPSGCLDIPPSLERALFAELQPFSTLDNAGEWLELYNPGPRDGAMLGLYLENAAGDRAPLRPPGDADGLLGLPVLLRRGGFHLGVPNPARRADIPPDATFVYGEPGTTFALDEAGDTLSLHLEDGTLLDIVDYRTPLASGLPAVHSDPGLAPSSGQFVVLPGRSLQLDARLLRPGAVAAANDSGDAWCLGLRASSTPGAPNGSCGEILLNEVYYDFDHPTLGGADESRVFVELAGPGGAVVAGVRLVATDGDSRDRVQRPDVTLGVPGPARHVVRLPPSGLLVVADGAVDGGSTLVPNADVVLAQGDAVNGNGNGDALLVLGPDGSVLDALAYGPASFGIGEGAPAMDLDPDRVGVALARRDLVDSGDNAADFHLDPTPTPGIPNDPVAPRLLGVTPLETHTDRTVQFLVRGVDLADYAALWGPEAEYASGGDLAAALGASALPDTVSFDDGCTLLGAASEGRGEVTARCTFTTPSVPGSLPFSLRHPAGLPAVDGRAVVGISRVANESGDANIEPSRCTLSGAGGSFRSGATSPEYSVFVAAPSAAALTWPRFVAQLAWGPAGGDPRDADASWSFADLVILTAGRASGVFTVPDVAAPTPLRVLARVSIDGGASFTYCDTDGAGRDPGYDFAPAQSYTLTALPPAP